MNKIRRFKPGEFLSNCFSARELGLALASDIVDALDDFPDVWGNDAPWKLENWYETWFSDFLDSELEENNE